MSKSGRRERRLRVRAIPSEQPDTAKLARALIKLAQQQLESEELGEHEPLERKEKP